MLFVFVLALSDPEARMQSLVTLFHSLPQANFKTAVFLFKHLRKLEPSLILTTFSVSLSSSLPS